jgi:hypothetical protein
MQQANTITDFIRARIDCHRRASSPIPTKCRASIACSLHGAHAAASAR